MYAYVRDSQRYTRHKIVKFIIDIIASDGCASHVLNSATSKNIAHRNAIVPVSLRLFSCCRCCRAFSPVSAPLHRHMPPCLTCNGQLRNCNTDKRLEKQLHDLLLIAMHSHSNGRFSLNPKVCLAGCVIVSASRRPTRHATHVSLSLIYYVFACV